MQITFHRRLLMMARQSEPSSHTLSINGPDTVEASSVTYSAVLDNTRQVEGAVWSILYGAQYASVGNDGTVTIMEGASNASVTIRCSYDGAFAEKEITLTYREGSSSHTVTESTTDPDDGSVTVTTTTVTTNSDGSSSTVSTATVMDTDGNVTGSTKTEETELPDGSSTLSITKYDSDGNPTNTLNNTKDSLGNSNTQNVRYDTDGKQIVTDYTIDTSGNETGSGETLDGGNGVNTGFIPFDGGEGFELHIRFRSVKSEQPNPPVVEDTEDKGTNYHFTILASKSAYSPYPGFHIRWTLNRNNYTRGNLQLGYRGKSGNTNNRSLTLSKNDGMYDFTISYDPMLKKYPSKFRCVDNLNGGALQTANIDFDPLDIEFTLGYNLNQQRQPYRYSNVTIYEFTIRKLDDV